MLLSIRNGLGILLGISCLAHGENWPAWRGPRGDGTSRETGIPTHWSATSNLVWKVPVPGVGHASPVVWGNTILTVSSLPDTEDRVLLAYDFETGQERWRTTVIQSPLEKKHRLNSHASSTPATDGKVVFTAFLDREDMVVSAHQVSDGKLLWSKRPGTFSSRHGFCSSPVIWRDLVIVNGDHDGPSYIVALDRKTGETRWKTPRENQTRSYCVPTIMRLSGRNQMLISGDQSVASYDPDTGKPHWYLQGPTEQWVASIVYNPGADLLGVTGGFPEHHVFGLRHDLSGTITEDAMAWHHERASLVSYVPSPISEGDYFILVSDPGYACCFRARDGEVMWQEKVGSHHASPVSANGLVYLVADTGQTTVVRPGPTWEVVATNPIGEKVFASPAISQGSLFLRGENHLFRVGLPPQASSGP